MKKLLVAITAALGLASAAVPASAGGSFGVSVGYYTAPSYGYNYVSPGYSYAPGYSYSYGYSVPTYSYAVPQYYAPYGTYSYDNSYTSAYKKHRRYKHHRKGHYNHHRGYYKQW